MKKTLSVFAIILLAFVLTAACTTTGQSSSGAYTSGPVPAWVTTPPASNKDFMYFIGLGVSKKADLAEAEKYAIQDIISSIIRYIGVEVTSQTSTEAKGTLDELTTKISREVVEKGSSRLAGFRVMEKWHTQDTSGIQLHILVQYETTAILKEKTRIEELFRSHVEAITIPESLAKEFEGSGKYYEAMLRYLDAAAAASTSRLENANILFLRNMDGAARVLEKITFVKISGDIQTVTGEEIGQPFTLKVVSGTGASAKPLAGTEITVAYKEYRNNTGTVKTQVLKTDNEGMVSFKHPVPTFSGQERVAMSIDVSVPVRKIQTVTKEQTDRVTSFQKLALTKKVEWTLTAVSKAANLPVSVYFVDLDENNKPFPMSQSTAGGINEVLAQEGFILKSSPISPAIFLGKKDSEVVGIIKQGTPGVMRVIIGTAGVESSQLDSGRYIVKVSGTVKVLDITTGNLIYEKTITKSVTGTNMESARQTAFKQLGQEIGRRIAAEAK
ncbi:MAG: hypothetical protein EHM28_03970 [Spirochaetaceae bacterium]|nr:MAG: hypothetical protein EHM28_03970 [Spirochaetaceae bacterium]